MPRPTATTGRAAGSLSVSDDRYLCYKRIWLYETKMPEHNFAEVFVYRQGTEKVEEGFKVDDIAGLVANPDNVVWIDLRGEDKADHAAIKDLLLNTFKFHYLTVEDCLETRNIPKIEAFTDYLYFIVHGVKPDESAPSKF